MTRFRNMDCNADVGGQLCPCPVLVSFLSGFSGKSCPVSVRCPDSVRIFCPVSVCPDSVCLDFVSCLDSVRIFRKNAVRCLSVRIFFVSILSAVGILSGFFEKRLSGVCLSGFWIKIVCPVSVWILSGIVCKDFDRHEHSVSIQTSPMSDRST